MKRVNSNIKALLIICITFVLFLAGCSKKTSPEDLAGYWRDEDDRTSIVLFLDSNNEYTVYSFDGNAGSTGNYKIKSKEIILYTSEENEFISFEYDGKNTIAYDTGEYTRVIGDPFEFSKELDEFKLGEYLEGRYYYEGDTNLGYFLFYSDGSVDIINENGDSHNGTYIVSIYGDSVLISVESESYELNSIAEGTLQVDGWDTIYVHENYCN